MGGHGDEWTEEAALVLMAAVVGADETFSRITELGDLTSV